MLYNVSLSLISPGNPVTLPREVNVIVSDGSGTSNEAKVYINFNATNDPPHVDLNGPFISGVNYETMFIEGDSDGVEVTLHMRLPDQECS